jgi:mannitol/fructose-specific phosphotransferase system IIA component (Ntr-type)
MKLSEKITPKRINLSLTATTRDGILEELIGLLHLKAPARRALLQTLQIREELGSTAVGGGVAIPHCRSLVVGKVLVAVGRSKRGVNFRASDKKRVKLFFLVVAPPVGDPGDYLIVLGAIAQVARLLAKDRRLKAVTTARQFINLVKELEK